MAGHSRVLRNEKIHEKPQSREQFSRIPKTQPRISGLQSTSATHSTVRLSHTKLIQIMVELVKIIINLLPVTTPFRISNSHQWRTEIPKALQNRAKLNPIVKTENNLLNLGRQHPKMFGKKAVKF